MSRLVASVLDATRACGHALERHQVFEAYTARHTSPAIGRRHLDTALRTLVSQGRLVRTVGRPGSYGYHHPGHQVPEAPLAQEVERLIAAVVRMYDELGRPVSTHELGHEMRQAAGVAHDYALFDHLLTQLTQSRSVGAARWREPILEIVTPLTTFGVRVRFWAPVGHEQASKAASQAAADARTTASGADTHLPRAAATPVPGMPTVPVRRGTASSPTEDASGPSATPQHGRAPLERDRDPGAGPSTVSAAHRGKAEALRVAVGLAQDALGRPVTGRELRWWCRAHADYPVAAVTQWGRGPRPFRDTARRDAFFPGRVGRLRAIANDLTCNGGAPLRYGLWRDTSTAAGELACLLDDILATTRLGTELEDLAALEVWRRQTRSETLGTLVHLRHAALKRVTVERIVAWVAAISSGTERALLHEPDSAAAAFARAFSTSERAVTTTQQWLAQIRLAPEEQSRVGHELRERRRHLAAAIPVILPWWLEHLASDTATGGSWFGGTDAGGLNATTPKIHVVGEAALVPLAALQPFCDPIAHAGGYIPEKYRYNLARGMRRFRALRSSDVTSVADRTPAYRRSASPPSQLDRVDAVVSAFRIEGVPRARAFVQGAARLLGHVVRDAQVMSTVYERCTDAGERRLLLVALGLLGATDAVMAVSSRIAAPSRPSDTGVDHGDARATALALACADPTRASGLLTALEPVWPHATRPVLATAATRLHAGYLQGVIE